MEKQFIKGRKRYLCMDMYVAQNQPTPPRACHSPLFVDFLFRKCFICSSGLLGCQGYVCFCSSMYLKVPSKPIFIFTLMAGVRTIIKGKKCQYLGSWATNHKTKDTLLSQTLKVEEKKVSLVFFICGPGAKIWPFYLLKLRK